MKKHTHSKAGFTLVELAIVLVIIGLIVGGVLVGADLIKAATLNKAIKQISDTDAAANTFRTKYNELPGDLRNATSIFPTITNGNTGLAGQGDGNGLIQATNGATPPAATASLGMSGESVAFYHEISKAGYLKETIGPVNMTNVAATAPEINATTTAALFPQSPLGRGAKLAASSDTSTNYIMMFGNATATASSGVSAGMLGAITPLQASNIDTKLDDGLADTGSVKTAAIAAPVPGVAETLGAALCANTGGVYNSGLTTTTLLCSLSIRASF